MKELTICRSLLRTQFSFHLFFLVSLHKVARSFFAHNIQTTPDPSHLPLPQDREIIKILLCRGGFRLKLKNKILHGNWPDSGLECKLYAHYLMGYRYHWHEAEYEIDIILHGKASFFRGSEIYTLDEDDVILIDPGIGHASLALKPDSVVLVLRFPASVFAPYFGADRMFSYAACRSGPQTRMERRFELIRFHATQIFHALNRGFPLSRLNARANMELLMVGLHRDFSPVVLESHTPQAEYEQAVVTQVKQYLDHHYTDKVTLADLARLTGYHRNYISTYFKKHTGTNIYSYLSRLRFQSAVEDLNFSEKTLTEIAVDNGFAELKLFNQQFRRLFRISPAEYRKRVVCSPLFRTLENDEFFPPYHPLVTRKINAYSRLTETSAIRSDGISCP